jgi:PAS domain-containing protein
MLTAQPWRVAIGTLAAGLILLLAALFIAGAMARRITGPIAALRRLAAAVDGDLPVEPLADVLPETAEVAALAGAARERQLALEAGAVGIFRWNVQAGDLRRDGRLRAIWAVPEGTQADIATFYAGIHPEDRAGVTAIFEAARRSEENGIFAAEYRVVGLSNGVQRTVAIRGKVTFDRRRSARLLGTVIDITERRVAEERQPCWRGKWIIARKMCLPWYNLSSA